LTIHPPGQMMVRAIEVSSARQTTGPGVNTDSPRPGHDQCRTACLYVSKADSEDSIPSPARPPNTRSVALGKSHEHGAEQSIRLRRHRL
jgi:hypothetical protein